MDTRNMTPAQIRRAGIEALTKELGPVGMMRFMEQFEMGSGDYTAERHQWLTEQSVDEVVERLRERRQRQSE